ncbi:MAG: hypothetical protein JRF31_13010 [Deltaproteobacteria bacterium]|nr:hypothetical protein [Deltaproteobacteria bacterium]
MPFLPIEPFNINYGLNQQATLSVMLFPKNPKKRKEFIQTHTVDAYLNVDINIMDKVTPNFLDELLHVPSIDTIQNSVTKIYAHAYQAGLIVTYLYLLQQLGKSPSMNRAVRLVENRYSKGIAKQNKMRPVAHSEESIRKNWRIFRPVSHLWATHINFNEESPIESPHDFDLFLARSEFFLSFCLGIVTERVNKPLFNKDEMWCVPAGYPLPFTESIEILEINEKIRSEIETYSVKGITP